MYMENKAASVHNFQIHTFFLSATELLTDHLMARSRFFFLQTRIAIPQYFSQSYGAYFKYIVRVHVQYVHVHTRTVNVCVMLMISYVILKYVPYDWLKCNPRLQKKKSRPGQCRDNILY